MTRTPKLGLSTIMPMQDENASNYRFITGSANDIQAVTSAVLESKIRQAHSVIWAGGKRDPLLAFDEWSKLLFAKFRDERESAFGEPRKFQIGRFRTEESKKENVTAVANRVRQLFEQGNSHEDSIFPKDSKIEMSDGKIAAVVEILQDMSFTKTDIDSVGVAFEHFFGSIFRGELGQYFTRRELARFTIAMLDVDSDDFIIDPTSGSGGFLLEAILQVGNRIETRYSQIDPDQSQRAKADFSANHIYGIEIHEILGRICKINLLLHHDGHKNIEMSRSCLDSDFSLSKLNPPKSKFSVVIGNPPFGDDVKKGDSDLLGGNLLSAFAITEGRDKIASELIILERSVELLKPLGRLGLVLPDGVFNNQGDLSNCPQTRDYLASQGKITAVVSLPDYAFKKSGAQIKTSILFFQKYSEEEKLKFDRAYSAAKKTGVKHSQALLAAMKSVEYSVFMAEANYIGYTPAGIVSPLNDLYRPCDRGLLLPDQSNTILGEYKNFQRNRNDYKASLNQNTLAISILDLWQAHPSRRLDPKYHIFKQEERSAAPEGWVKERLGSVMSRREEPIKPESDPDATVVVMTLSQTGDIKAREAGKGRNPPEWRGMYFADIPSVWFQARVGDVVYSSIDLWKGCISLVPPAFDRALVTKEFPIYQVTDSRIEPEFLSVLLRTRFYQKAFRAITTGHSNRRRTQQDDFENLEICFPADRQEQLQLIKAITDARQVLHDASRKVKSAQLSFSDLIDGRGDEELPQAVIEEA